MIYILENTSAIKAISKVKLNPKFTRLSSVNFQNPYEVYGKTDNQAWTKHYERLLGVPMTPIRNQKQFSFDTLQSGDIIVAGRFHSASDVEFFFFEKR